MQSTQHQRSALAKRYTLRPKSFKISEHSDITRSLTMGSPSPMGGEDVSLDYRSTRERRTSSAAAQATQKKTQHSAADTACAVGSSDWGAMTAQSLTPEVRMCVRVYCGLLMLEYDVYYLHVCVYRRCASCTPWSDCS